ncbi:MAG: transaldolase [Anaerolineales bacterium]|nr:transaldolase [Anaerolineae bacterium]PWB72483.1 MAG: transaldolase [Anaerolineales bacterium]
MAIYLDSAKLDEARQAKDFGWIYGVTTNPSLMAKAGVEPDVALRGLADLEFNQVYYQLVSQNLEDMLAEAYQANEIVKEGLILKIAPTETGFRFVAKHGKVFPCCVTAIFDPAQALIARDAGARYIAVYVNRATKQLGDGLALVRELAKVLAGSQTEILAASLKYTKEAVDASIAGAQHITVPFDLLTSLSTHPLSVQTVEHFNKDGVGIRLKS